MTPLSGANPKVRLARRLLSRRKDRYDERAFVVQGPVLVREALSFGVPVRFILCRQDSRASVDAPGVDVHVVDDDSFDDINDTTTPQGVLAVCDMPEPSALDLRRGWYLVAHEVSDPGNLGTIIRSAEAAGASGVIVTDGTVDPFAPKTVRASAGALFHVPVMAVSDLRDSRLSSLTLVGTTSHAGSRVEDLWNADVAGHLAFVFGSEAHGVSPDEPIERWVRIPHSGRSESLNVAMAATVLAMHVGRVRADSSSD